MSTGAAKILLDQVISGRLFVHNVIMFGLVTLGVIQIPWVYADMRMQYQGRAGTFANSAYFS